MYNGAPCMYNKQPRNLAGQPGRNSSVGTGCCDNLKALVQTAGFYTCKPPYILPRIPAVFDSSTVCDYTKSNADLSMSCILIKLHLLLPTSQ